MQKPSILGISLLLIGIGIILQSGCSLANEYFLDQWVSIEGEIIDKQIIYVESIGGTPQSLEERDLNQNRIFQVYPMVYYQYVVEDTLYNNDLVTSPQLVYFSETQSSLEAENAINKYEIGEAVELFYRKKNPTTAVLILPERKESFSDFYIILFGLVLIAFMIRQLQNRRPMYQSIFVHD